MPTSFIVKENILPTARIQKSKRAGFTLLELIGVMVIISILLAVALPSTIDLIQVQRSANEAAELPKIAEALKRGMLREQIFPIYQNNASVSTDGSDAYWWNLAARHGGGSANELRYPLGVRPGADNTRKLYFANTAWSGDSFFDIVSGNQASWIADFQDPSELRLLLLSTTSSDLELPDTLNTNRFNGFWNDWAVGSDGNPSTGSWNSYGLGNDWAGRATELNVERIDLRDWLCTVVIENRRAIEEASGANLSSALSGALGFWDRGSVFVSSTNLQDAQFIIQARETTEDLNQNGLLDSGEDADENNFLDKGEDVNGNGTLDQGEDIDGDNFLDHPAKIYTYVEAVIQTQRGRRIEVEKPNDAPPTPKPASVTISGRRSSTPTEITALLTLTDRAPMALLNPNDSTTPSPLTGWSNADDYIQNRYFLRSQELLLGEPWTQTEVGIFTISETFSTLRFDGLEWQY
jgi:prepilin-type N-terminal cleavage/methylation domain-containing protein